MNRDIEWSGSLIKSWPRFLFHASLHSAVLAFVIYKSAQGSWDVVLPLIAYLGIAQIRFLYAIRQLYLELTKRETEPASGACRA